MYRSPAGAPFSPASPSPLNLRRDPVSTPAGILILTRSFALILPSPLHFLHGSVIITPSPLHCGHTVAIRKKPPELTTCPVPLHVGHVTRFDFSESPVP